MQKIVHTADVRGDLLAEGMYGSIYTVKGAPKYIIKIPKLERYNQNAESIMMSEISILKALKGFNNIVQVAQIIYDTANIPSIIMYRYTSDLSRVYPIQGLHLKSFMFDICNGLLAVHDLGFYHLDIKPSNLLLENGRVYVGDFGLAKKAFPNTDEIMSCIAQATFCRAPEILLTYVCRIPCRYSYAADIWSLGIVMYHLKTGTYPFMANTELDILRKIFKTFEITHPIECDVMTKIHDYEISTKILEQQLKVTQDQKIEFDFLVGLLHPDPARRSTMNDIFNHAYFNIPVHTLQLVTRTPTPNTPNSNTSIATGKHYPILTYREKVVRADFVKLPSLRVLYQGQLDLNLKMRTILVTWLISISDRFVIHESVIFYAIALLDRYVLITKKLNMKQLHLIGIACFIIANRLLYHEVLTIDTFRDVEYTQAEIEQAVLRIMKHLDYSLCFSTEYDYLTAYIMEPIYRQLPYDIYELLYTKCIFQLKANLSKESCRNINFDLHARTVLAMYSMSIAGINPIDIS